MTTYWQRYRARFVGLESWLVGGTICFAMSQTFAFKTKSAVAQITQDATLPINSNVILEGNTFNITGGTQAGSNLFHSFGEFSVPTDFIASFNNATNIQNIISRVTGGSVSNINGSIRTLGTANLFLINPSGIIFGPNASLDVRGSFVATTANAIQFGNQGFFSATNPNTPALLTVNPSAFLFNQIATASIQNNSVAPAGLAPSNTFTATGLRVPDGQSLLLVGGNVSMDGGGLYAFGGQVELGGATAGTVGLNVDSNFLSLSFPDAVARADVSLSNGSRVDVSAGDSGSITINARNLDILGESSLAAGIGEGLGTVGSQAGNITLNATGAITVADSSTIYDFVENEAVGNSGNIDITAGTLSVTNGAQLVASTLGQGDAGNVTITANGAVRFDGVGSNGVSSGAFSTVEVGAVGKGGNVNITAGSLSVTNGAGLTASTLGQGDAGSVTITASGTVRFDGVRSDGVPSSALSRVEPLAVGNGGNVNIRSESLSVTNGASLSSRTYGQGDAGSVTINAIEAVSFDGIGSTYVSGAGSSVEAGAVGTGGNVNITTRSLSVTNGAQLGAGTFGVGNAGDVNITATDSVSLEGTGSNGYPSVAASSVQNPNAVGNGGNVNITTRSLSVTNGAQLITSTFGVGNAGNVTIQASEAVSFDGVGSNGYSSVAGSSVEVGAIGTGGNVNITTRSLSVTNGAALSVSTAGQENAGDINITARSLSVTNGSQLIASTSGKGDAGNVNIQASEAVSFDNSITSSASNTGAEGNGGDINITARSLSVSNGAQLIASTSGKGNAGNVNIQASDVVSFDGVDMSGYASAAASTVEEGAEGKGGSINITTRLLTIKNGAGLTAGTSGKGDAGDINIATKRLSVRDGGRVATSTSGVGRGGTLKVTASDSVELAGSTPDDQSATGLFARTLATGNAGNLKIATGQLIVRNGAEVSVSGTSSGNAGNIEVAARSIYLDNQGKLIAETASGQGGNITLKVQDLLLLRRGSSISTNAGRAQADGDGGNITIDTKFIVAVPSENSDISANAYIGKGGRVIISTQNFRGNAVILQNLTLRSEERVKVGC